MTMSTGRGAPLILLYHQIGTRREDPFRQFVSAENFAGHMEIVAARGAVRLRDLAAGLRAGELAPGAVAVTFDDGYLSNLRLAKPALERTAVPATVFVTTGMTGGERDFWWNELAVALARAPEGAGALRLAAGGHERAWPLSVDERDEALFEVWAWIRAQRPSHIPALIEATRAWAGIEPGGPPGDDVRCMTVGELGALAAGGLIDVGAHTRTHPMLAACSRREQRDEIGGSRADLEQWLGRAVTAFAYPFGTRVLEYRAAAVRAVRAAGFSAATAVASRPLTARSPILELPRHAVPDIAPDAFERWLAERIDGPPPPRRALDARPVRMLRERRRVRDRL